MKKETGKPLIPDYLVQVKSYREENGRSALRNLLAMNLKTPEKHVENRTQALSLKESTNPEFRESMLDSETVSGVTDMTSNVGYIIYL